MLNNGNKSNCEFTNEIVSYIYDEIGTSERAKFKNHLVGCHECTNEFAVISNARLSVYEWQRQEFADLPTPEIVIPYRAKRHENKESVSIGLFASFRSMFSFANFPAAVAAGLIMCVGLGFLLLNYLGGGEKDLAANVNIPVVETAVRPAVIPTGEIKKPEIAAETVLPNRRADRQIKPVKAVQDRRLRIEKQTTARNSIDQNSIPAISIAPVLSENLEEADDKSLRLSDLFADDEG